MSTGPLGGDAGLPGAVAIITGGTGGLGPAVGVALAARGVGHIVFAQRGLANDAVQAVHAAGGSALSIACDQSSRSGVATFFATFCEIHSRLDILVNCSGICPRTPTVDVRETELESVFESMLLGRCGFRS